MFPIAFIPQLLLLCGTKIKFGRKKITIPWCSWSRRQDERIGRDSERNPWLHTKNKHICNKTATNEETGNTFKPDGYKARKKKPILENLRISPGLSIRSENENLRVVGTDVREESVGGLIIKSYRWFSHSWANTVTARILTLLGLQSRVGDKPVKFQVVLSPKRDCGSKTISIDL